MSDSICPTPEARNDGNRNMVLFNGSNSDVWIGLWSSHALIEEPDSWKLKQGACANLVVSGSARTFVWFRTHCNATDGTRCLTGECRATLNGNGKCPQSSPPGLNVAPLLDTPAGLVEIDLGGAHPDIYSLNTTRGYNGSLRVSMRGGSPVSPDPGPRDFCDKLLLPNITTLRSLPKELLVYDDAECPKDESRCVGDEGYTQDSSFCFLRPDESACEFKIIAVRSACTALSKGWISEYINAQEEESTFRQFWTGSRGGTCGGDWCRNRKALGTLSGREYGTRTCQDLMCAGLLGVDVNSQRPVADQWFCSPFTTNERTRNMDTPCAGPTDCQDSPDTDHCNCWTTKNGSDYFASFNNLLPTIGSTSYPDNRDYPQCNEPARIGSQYPDFPRASDGVSYGKTFDPWYQNSPVSTGLWQRWNFWAFNDGSNDFRCETPTAIVIAIEDVADDEPPPPPPPPDDDGGMSLGEIIGYAVLGAAIIAGVITGAVLGSRAAAKAKAPATETPPRTQQQRAQAQPKTQDIKPKRTHLPFL